MPCKKRAPCTELSRVLAVPPGMCWLSPCNSSGGCSVHQHPSCWRASTQPRGAWPGSEGSAGAGAGRQELDPFTARGAEGRGDLDSPPLGGRLGAVCPFPWGSWGGQLEPPGQSLQVPRAQHFCPRALSLPPELLQVVAFGGEKWGDSMRWGVLYFAARFPWRTWLWGAAPRCGSVVPWSHDRS